MCGDCRNHRARLPDWLTARQTWPLARLSPLFLSLFLSLPPLYRCTPVHRMHFTARCAANSAAANVSPIYLRDRTQLPPSTPFSSSSSSSCFSLLFCRFVLRFLPVNRSSVHLDSSFCSRFSRSCWPFAPIHSPCTSLFDSTRGYIGFFCLLLRGCFLLASLSRLIIVLPARCLLSPAPHLHLSRSLNPHT